MVRYDIGLDKHKDKDKDKDMDKDKVKEKDKDKDKDKDKEKDKEKDRDRMSYHCMPLQGVGARAGPADGARAGKSTADSTSQMSLV